MLKAWIKEGLIEGGKGVIFFAVVCAIWALIIQISDNLGISPGWSMMAFFLVGIFTMSLSVAKTKYDMQQKMSEYPKEDK